MRFIGSLIKYFIYLSLVLIAAGAALFWFDTGSWFVKPLAERAGSFFLSPMKLEIQSVDGSLRNGYTIDRLRLVSGDENLAVLNHFSVSPDWDLVLSGMNGLPFIKSLNLKGLSSDLDSVMKIASLFTSSEDESPEEEDEDDSSTFDLKLNPSNISIEDIYFGTPYANLSLASLTLDEAGKFLLDAEVTSGENVFPLRADAKLNLSPVEIISSDLSIGNKGTGKLTGTVSPLNAKLALTALSLEELMKFAPVSLDVDGRIDGRVSVEDKDGNIAASGIVSMPRANVMEIPLSFRLPFTWNGKNIFTLDDASLTTKAAALSLKVTGDIEKMKFKAKGEGKNISLTEIGKMFAPEVGLLGDNGNFKFDVDTELTDNVLQSLLQRTRATASANIPSISAMGIKTAENLTASVNLTPGSQPKISMGGRAFGGKIFARGEAAQDQDGIIKPQGVVMSIVGLDVPSVVNTFPELAKSIGRTYGKITATARISEALNVSAKVTSDKLSAYGVTLTGINGEAFYNLEKNTVELQELRASLGNGQLRAKANADLGTGNFTAHADALNIDLRVIPDLKQASGLYALKADASGNFNDTKTITADALVTARNAGFNGIRIGNADIPVNFADNILTVKDAAATLPSGSAILNAIVDINNSTFKADADIKNLELKFIPGLKDLSGKYTLKADASGNYSDLNTIMADAVLNARNMGFQGMNFGNADVPVSFKNNVVSIHNAKASIPGGTVNLKGTANVKNASNPALDFTASTSGINLAQLMNALKLQDKSMPISGKVRGSFGIKGPLNTAVIDASVQADSIKAGDIVSLNSANINARTDVKMSGLRAKIKADGLKATEYADVQSALLEAEGNGEQIIFKNLKVNVNGAEITGDGLISPNQKDIMASAMNVDMRVKHLDLRAMLKKFMGQAPVEGVIDAKAGITGTVSQPALNLQLTRPVLYGKIAIHDIGVKLRSPEQNHFLLNAKARVGNFKPETDVDIKLNNGVVNYIVDTAPLDIESAIETQAPEMAGIAKGQVQVHVKGSTREGAPIIVNAKSKGITVIDKVDIQDINIPVKYLTSENRVEMTGARARLSGGDIKTSFAADIGKKETEWNGNVKVANLDFGKLATKFLPEGELTGSVDAQVSMKGSSNSETGMNLSFANGKFKTGPGCLRKVKMIESITPTKQISFEEISGSFFWDGKDLFLNPGTGARAGVNEPLYRYFTVNGSAGIPGKGMNLLCDGRFDLKLLDRLLGAMKGVFQYMTGGLARNVLRDAVSRVMGIKKRDFQNVSFRIANSLQKPQLRDLKVTKPIEDFLPIDILNKDEEKQKETTQFKMSIKLPVGKGSPSAEDESPGDQVKQQLIDNLFNIGL